MIPLLNTLLHSPNMLKIQRILPQTPRHNSPDPLLIHNLLKLAPDQRRRIPRPEHVNFLVEEVLPAGFLVGLPVFLGAAPRVDC